MKKQEITEEQIEAYRLEIRALSNSVQYDKAHSLSKRLMQQYPKVLVFAYYEAVMTAEDDENFTQAQVDRRYAKAAAKLKKLLLRTRGASASFVGSLKNEYYWFSRQPYKQYLLGVSEQNSRDKKVKRGGYYSAGVGATMLARKYALEGKKARALKWAKISEKSWKNFFKLDSKWFNSYFFYAWALGYQNRIKEADKAFATAAKVAKKPKNWSYIAKERAEMIKIRDLIWNT